MAKLTHFQIQTLRWLDDLRKAHPQNTWGFLARYRPRHAAVCRRALEPIGFVAINRIADNCFRYSITEAGRRALEDTHD